MSEVMRGARETQTTYFQKLIETGTLSELKAHRVEGDAATPSFGRKTDLSAHLQMLKLEFAGKSELELYHAAVIVLLRRGIDQANNARRFFELWSREKDFLLEKLDTRWLVSACDTIIDFSSDKVEIGFACAGTIIANLVKLYETEIRALKPFFESQRLEYSQEAGRIELFDGLCAFVIGKGDMVYNLQCRVRRACPSEGVSPRILLELVSRMNKHDTVLSRFRRVHLDSQTTW